MILEEATGEKVELPCRSIRVGSYKSMPKERAVFTEKGIHLRVPDICSGRHYSRIIVIKIFAQDFFLGTLLHLQSGFNRLSTIFVKTRLNI